MPNWEYSCSDTALVFRTESDHHLCDPTSPLGCSRCVFPPPKLCCDIHHPIHFNSGPFRPFDDIAVMKHQYRPAMPKGFERSEVAGPLVQALRVWRDKKTQELYGSAYLNDFGGSLVLPDNILQRIIDCASIARINSTESLCKETHWSEAEEHGNEVVALIQMHIPASVWENAGMFHSHANVVVGSLFSHSQHRHKNQKGRQSRNGNRTPLPWTIQRCSWLARDVNRNVASVDSPDTTVRTLNTTC